MPLVHVMVNERSYAIACDEGQEEHLLKLAAHVDSKVRELLKAAGQPGEQRLLLMAALMIADEYFESRALLERRAQEVSEACEARQEALARIGKAEHEAVLTLDSTAARIEDVAGRLPGA
ncbi:MAG TPA: cell division protein ZapA [Rhizomicrobium sp.]|nr:cell division protein ZapA [Rhizomicrobium sp.]